MCVISRLSDRSGIYSNIFIVLIVLSQQMETYRREHELQNIPSTTTTQAGKYLYNIANRK